MVPFLAITWQTASLFLGLRVQGNEPFSPGFCFFSFLTVTSVSAVSAGSLAPFARSFFPWEGCNQASNRVSGRVMIHQFLTDRGDGGLETGLPKLRCADLPALHVLFARPWTMMDHGSWMVFFFIKITSPSLLSITPAIKCQSMSGQVRTSPDDTFLLISLHRASGLSKFPPNSQQTGLASGGTTNGKMKRVPTLSDLSCRSPTGRTADSGNPDRHVSCPSSVTLPFFSHAYLVH